MIAYGRWVILPSDRLWIRRALRPRVFPEGWWADALAGLVRAATGLRAVPVSSGTAALHLLLETLRISGRRVIVPAYTCSAVLVAVRNAGADPLVADVDPETFTLSAETVRRAWRRGAAAVVAVHAFGVPAPLVDLRDLGVPIIEDAAHAFGATYRGRPVGAWGSGGITSFSRTKPMMAGGGGLVLTRLSSVVREVRGMTRYDQPTRLPAWNYTLPDIQAALIYGRLRRWSRDRMRLERMAARYRRALPGDVRLQFCPPEGDRVWGVFAARWPSARRRQRALQVLEGAEFGAAPPLAPETLPHRLLGLDRRRYPSAEALAATTLAIPLDVGMSDRDAARVAEALRNT